MCVAWADITNVDGLAGVTSAGGGLHSNDNAVLDGFFDLFPLLDANGLVGTYTIGGNATNPTEAEILAAGACFVPPAPGLGTEGVSSRCWQ